jgi:hypothetical protein
MDLLSLVVGFLVGGWLVILGMGALLAGWVASLAHRERQLKERRS